MSNRIKREGSVGGNSQNHLASPSNLNISAPMPGSSVLSTASSNLSGSNDFVKKLFQMLQEDDYKDVVRWTHSGDSFVVLNTNEFTKDVLPRHFKHSNFASFVRQLNKYDFHKVKISNEEKVSYPYGDDAWEFKHPDFKMNDRESLENIKRKGPSNKKNTTGSPSLVGNPGNTADTQMINAAANNSFITCNHNYNQINTSQVYLKDQVDRLKHDNKSLYQQINILETKYKTLIDNIVSINTFNERCHDSIGVLLNCLMQAGIKLPPLDFPNPSLMSLQAPPGRAHGRQPHQQVSIQQQGVIAPNGGPTYLHVRPTPPSNDSLSSTAPSPLINTGLSPGGAAAQSQTSVPTVGQHSPLIIPLPAPDITAPIINAAGKGSMAEAAMSASNSRHPSVSHANNGTTTTTNTATGATTTTIPNPKFHVLLVEDDNVCIQLCRKFLVKYGCEVTVVTDGLNAISTVEHTKYDLVLMDIVMPNLDGATATSVIRSFDTKTPIIAMTGNIEDNDLVNYLQNGMSDILAKPFTKDDLYSILSKHLLNNESEGTSGDSQATRRVSVGPPVPVAISSSAPIIITEDEQLLKKQRLK